jgi:hypothetical protein
VVSTFSRKKATVPELPYKIIISTAETPRKRRESLSMNHIHTNGDNGFEVKLAENHEDDISSSDLEGFEFSGTGSAPTLYSPSNTSPQKKSINFRSGRISLSNQHSQRSASTSGTIPRRQIGGFMTSRINSDSDTAIKV